MDAFVSVDRGSHRSGGTSHGRERCTARLNEHISTRTSAVTLAEVELETSERADREALTVVQQEHEAQKIRQEEHDVDQMTKQRKVPIIQEQHDFSVIPGQGAARSEDAALDVLAAGRAQAREEHKTPQ